MTEKSILSLIGGLAFLIGIIIAAVFAVMGLIMPEFTITPLMAVILVIIGIIVGLLNVTSKEASPFLMSGAVLIIASSLGRDVVNVIHTLSRFLDSLLLIFVPATIIVAIRNVFVIAHD
jgi:hypothetical protein